MTGRDDERVGANVFVYGSLLFDDVFTTVTGIHASSEPATLRGFARYRVSEATYPAITREAGASTLGALIRGLDASAMAALDRFEGDMYIRERVHVVTELGVTVEAHTYVIVDDAAHLLEDAAWDPDEAGPAARAQFAATDPGDDGT